MKRRAFLALPLAAAGAALAGRARKEPDPQENLVTYNMQLGANEGWGTVHTAVRVRIRGVNARLEEVEEDLTCRSPSRTSFVRLG